MEEKFKILDGTIGYDIKTQSAYVVVPLTSVTRNKKGNMEIQSIPHYVDSKYQFWPLSQEEQEKRRIYLTTTPLFFKGYEPWSKDCIESFVKLPHHDLFDALDPYHDVFEPIHLILTSSVDFYNPIFSTIITLWIMGTYLSPIFDAYPYIFLSGTRGSGKTKVLEFVRYVAYLASLTSNATTSSVFRIAQANRSTLLIDEGEMLGHSKGNADLRLILNAGYRKNNPVMRTNKDSHQVEFFDVTAAKMIGAINPLEPTLKSRCIELVMVRTSDKNKGNRRINDSTAEWGLMRDALYKFGLLKMTLAKEIYESDQDVNIQECRQNELFAPLLTIAKIVDREGKHGIFKQVKDYALSQNDEDEPLDDWHAAILLILNDIVKVTRTYTIKEIKAMTINYIEDFNESERMTSRWIGAALNRFGLKKGIRRNDGNTYIISRAEVDELLKRYQLYGKSALPVHSEHSVDNTGEELPLL